MYKYEYSEHVSFSFELRAHNRWRAVLAFTVGVVPTVSQMLL